MAPVKKTWYYNCMVAQVCLSLFYLTYYLPGSNCFVDLRGSQSRGWDPRGGRKAVSVGFVR